MIKTEEFLENVATDNNAYPTQIFGDFISLNSIGVALVQTHLEVMILNERLKVENLRMGAELNVTRQLQEMILPKTLDLCDIESLDITCYMQPASEVGGDYYDVINQDGRLKIGIGDVTGHGLESGVLMIMVQTAVCSSLVYRDITEATNIHEVQYGIERLIEVVKQNLPHSAKTIKQATLADVRSHIGTSKIFDDITLLVMKQKPGY